MSKSSRKETGIAMWNQAKNIPDHFLALIAFGPWSESLPPSKPLVSTEYQSGPSSTPVGGCPQTLKNKNY